MIEQLNSFVKNGGRLRANEEPRLGEPFYGEYMKQFLSLHYMPGDKVKLHVRFYNNESKVYEGTIIALDYNLRLLTSGRKVYKDRRNRQDINYAFIESIEMVKPDDGTFDLSVVDSECWKWKNNCSKNNITSMHEKTENRRRQREEDRKEFHQAYPDVDFDKVHVIKVSKCSMYWPFNYDNIRAEVFLIRGNDKITSISCRTGTPYPNKNSFHAYNCKTKHGDTDLYMYLPDDGTTHEDVNIVCVWTINTSVSGKDTAIKVVNIHHVGNIKPFEDEYNMIFVDMSVCPLLGHGSSLFSNSRNYTFLTCMMNHDIYTILDIKDDTAVVVKSPEGQTEKDLEKYLFMFDMAVDSFILQDIVQRVSCEHMEYFPCVEVFCNVDKEPERYYSSSWYHCREGYSFKMLEG